MRKTSSTKSPLSEETAVTLRSPRESEPNPVSRSPARKEPASDAPDGARTGTRRRGKKREPVIVAKPGIVLWNAVRLEEIGESVRLKRKALDYTLDDLERLTGVSKRTLIKLEAGGDVRYSTLLKVLSAVGLVLVFNGPSADDLRKIRNGTYSTNIEGHIYWF